MPDLTIDGKTYSVEAGERLVLAIERSGVAIGHRCGGVADCTTCRVQFISGEPRVMTEAEYNRLLEAGLIGRARLACQIEVDQDMSLRVLDRVDQHPEWQGDPGPEPEELVEPEAIWYPIEETGGEE